MTRCGFWFRSEQRDRKCNEDRGWAGPIRLPDGEAVRVAIVADGAGASRNGGEVAEIALATLKHAIANASSGELLDDSRTAVWREQWESSLQRRVAVACPGGCSTLVAAIQIRQDLLLLSVGDSPLFLVGATGVHRVFEPHTSGMEKIHHGIPEETIPPEDFSTLVRAVGVPNAEGTALLDCKRIRGEQDIWPQWIVMGSDGVFNHIDGSDLMLVIRQSGWMGASRIASRLLALSSEKGRGKGVRYMDNASVAVFAVKGNGAWKRVPGALWQFLRRHPGRTVLAAVTMVFTLLAASSGIRVFRRGAVPQTVLPGWAFLTALSCPEDGQDWARTNGCWYPRGGTIAIDGVSYAIQEGIIHTGTNEIEGKQWRFASNPIKGTILGLPPDETLHPWAVAYRLETGAESPQDAGKNPPEGAGEPESREKQADSASDNAVEAVDGFAEGGGEATPEPLAEGLSPETGQSGPADGGGASAGDGKTGEKPLLPPEADLTENPSGQ